MQAFNPISMSFEASLAYRVSSRTARTTQRNPALENNKQTNGYKRSKLSMVVTPVILAFWRQKQVDPEKPCLQKAKQTKTSLSL